jgi:hypothetical protein
MRSAPLPYRLNLLDKKNQKVGHLLPSDQQSDRSRTRRFLRGDLTCSFMIDSMQSAVKNEEALTSLYHKKT